MPLPPLPFINSLLRILPLQLSMALRNELKGSTYDRRCVASASRLSLYGVKIECIFSYSIASRTRPSAGVFEMFEDPFYCLFRDYGTLGPTLFRAFLTPILVVFLLRLIVILTYLVRSNVRTIERVFLILIDRNHSG